MSQIPEVTWKLPNAICVHMNWFLPALINKHSGLNYLTWLKWLPTKAKRKWQVVCHNHQCEQNNWILIETLASAHFSPAFNACPIDKDFRQGQPDIAKGRETHLVEMDQRTSSND